MSKLNKSKQKILSAKGNNKLKLVGINKTKLSKSEMDSLPDPMNSPAKIIGAKIDLPQVGISNLQIPFRVFLGKQITAEICCNISATVSLKAGKRGINMSRILRELCGQDQLVLNKASVTRLLINLARNLETNDVSLRFDFSFPLNLASLRSDHAAMQYYKAAIEAKLVSKNKFEFFNELEFIYSSACPCSTELSEHAVKHRAVTAIPHSQRSLANIRVALAAKSDFIFEKLIELCRQALLTETQMIVRRVDEQAFAELNGANQKFVEDAVRLLYQSLDQTKEVAAFNIECTHFESLHSHNAYACVSNGF